jgi:hypothetical protein
MKTETLVGKLADPKAGRDAIHVPVIATLAIRELRPGERLSNGVVDPFLTANVKPGEWFWLFVTPGSVCSLRHVWTHAAFRDETASMCEREPLHQSFDAKPEMP